MRGFGAGLGALAQLAAGAAAPACAATLIFSSGFEGDVTLGAPLLHGNGAWQEIRGSDSETGFRWPPRLWGGPASRFQLIVDERARVASAQGLRATMFNELQQVAGRDGRSTRALHSVVLQAADGAHWNAGATQNVFLLLPGREAQGELYIRYWLRLQPDLLERMTVGPWAGRVIADWKTGEGSGASPGADYRVLLSIFGHRAERRLYWHFQGDNIANGGLVPQVYWELRNTRVPVPAGAWFRVEMFARRSGSGDGRLWVAIDGQTLFDRRGPNLGVNGKPWNRIMPFLNYSTHQRLPAYQWVDDFEVWNGLPPNASLR